MGGEGNSEVAGYGSTLMKHTVYQGMLRHGNKVKYQGNSIETRGYYNRYIECLTVDLDSEFKSR